MVFITFLFFTICLAAFIFAVWQMVKRPNRRRLLGRLLAVAGSFTAILLLWLQPKWSRRVQLQQVLLLTEGTDSDSVQRILQQVQPRPRIFTSDSATGRQFMALHPAFIPDLAYLRRHFRGIRKLHITGFGLPRYELNHLDSLQVAPHLSLPPPFLQSADWPKQLHLGDSLRVQVTAHPSTNAPAWFWLVGGGSKLDSVEIKGGQSQAFQLKTLPKAAGQQIFYLQWQEKAQRFREKIPFVVQERPPLRVLMLENYPTFETKFLKNWLVERGNQVAVRASISRARFSTEFLNHEKVFLNRLTPKLLQTFDILLLDGETVNGLSRSEQSAIEQTVQEGLGVLITVAGSLSRNALTNPFKVHANLGAREKLIVPIWRGAPKAMTAIPVVPLTLSQTSGAKPLVFTKNGQNIAVMQPNQKGKIGIILATSTYTWVLDGKPKLHRGFWSLLLQEISRPKPVTATWHVTPRFPRVHEPVQVSVINENNQPPVLLVDSTSLYTKSIENDWLQGQGTYWPRRPGWQQTQTAEEEVSWYVYESDDWASVCQHEKYRATLAYVNGRSVKQADLLVPETTHQPEKIPSFWFALLFLLSTGFLWLERKW